MASQNDLNCWIQLVLGTNRDTFISEIVGILNEYGYIFSINDLLMVADELSSDPKLVVGEKISLLLGQVIALQQIGSLLKPFQDNKSLTITELDSKIKDHCVTADAAQPITKTWLAENLLSVNNNVVEGIYDVLMAAKIENLQLFIQVPDSVFRNPKFLLSENIITIVRKVITDQFTQLATRVRKVNPGFYTANFSTPANHLLSILSTTDSTAVPSTPAFSAPGNIALRNPIATTSSVESFDAPLGAINSAEPTEVSHYKLVMSFAGKIGAKLLDIAYLESINRIPNDRKVFDLWCSAVVAREINNDDLADNTVQLALNVSNNWLPFRHVCAILHNSSPGSDKSPFLVPRIEYEALCAYHKLNSNFVHSLTKKCWQICRDNLYQKNNHAWTYCRKMDPINNYSSNSTTGCCSTAINKVTQKLKYCPCGGSVLVQDIDKFDVSCWDAPLWLNSITFWQSKDVISDKGSYKFFTDLHNKSFPKTHPELQKLLTYLGSTSKTSNENINELTHKLLSFRNSESHNDSAWAVHTFISIFEFIYVIKQQAEHWINLGIQQQSCSELVALCDEYIAKLINNNSISNFSHENYSKQLCVFNNAIDNYETSGSIRVLVASPLAAKMTRQAIPGVPWSAVIDFCDVAPTLGDPNPTALWKCFQDAENSSQCGVRLNKSAIFYPNSTIQLYNNISNGVPWIMPLISKANKLLISPIDNKCDISDANKSTMIALMTNVATLLHRKGSIETKTISIVIPMYHCYGLMPMVIDSQKKFEFTRTVKSYKAASLYPDSYFPLLLTQFLEVLQSQCASNLSMLKICIVTDNKQYFSRLQSAINNPQSSRNLNVWPCCLLKSNVVSQCMTVSCLSEGLLELSYVSSNVCAGRHSFEGRNDGVRILVDGVATLMCHDTAKLSAPGNYDSVISDSFNYESTLRKRGMQLLHLTFPYDALNRIKQDPSFLRFIENSHQFNDSSSLIPATIKYSAVSFVGGDEPEWVLVNDSFASDYNTTFVAKRAVEYNRIIKVAGELWEKANVTTTVFVWKLIIEHEYKCGGSTMGKQVAWNYFFNTLHAGVFQILLTYTRNISSSDQLTVLHNLKAIYALTKKPVVVFMDRCVDEDFIVSSLSNSDFPIFFVIVRRTTSFVANAYDCVKITMHTLTAKEISEVDTTIENIMKYACGDVNFSMKDINSKMRKKSVFNENDQMRFLRSRGMIFFKNLNNKILKSTWVDNMSNWLAERMKKMYSKRFQQPSVVRTYHALCYVALVQLCWDYCSGIQFSSLIPVLSDPLEQELLKNEPANISCEVFSVAQHKASTELVSISAIPELYSTLIPFYSDKPQSTIKLNLNDDNASIAQFALSELKYKLTRTTQHNPNITESESICMDLTMDVQQIIRNDLTALDSHNEELWHELLRCNRETLHFRPEMAELFLKVCLDIEFEGQLVNNEYRYYYLSMRLLHSLMRDNFKMQWIDDPYHKFALDPDHENIDSSTKNSLFWRAQHVFTSKQQSVKPNQTSDRFMYSWLIAKIVGDGENIVKTQLSDCISVPSPLGILIAAQSIFGCKWRLSASTIRLMIVLMESCEITSATTSTSQLPDFGIGYLVKMCTEIYACCTARCLISVTQLPQEIAVNGRESEIWSNKRTRMHLRSRSYDMLGNATRNYLHVISSTTLERISSLVVADSVYSDVLRVCKTEIGGLISIGNIARYWYWQSLEEVNDQIPALLDECYMWIELMHTIREVWKLIMKLNSSAEFKELQFTVFDIDQIMSEWKYLFSNIANQDSNSSYVQESRQLVYLTTIDSILMTISEKMDRLQLAIECKVDNTNEINASTEMTRLRSLQTKMVLVESFLADPVREHIITFEKWMKDYEDLPTISWLDNVHAVSVKFVSNNNTTPKSKLKAVTHIHRAAITINSKLNKSCVIISDINCEFNLTNTQSNLTSFQISITITDCSSDNILAVADNVVFSSIGNDSSNKTTTGSLAIINRNTRHSYDCGDNFEVVYNWDIKHRKFKIVHLKVWSKQNFTLQNHFVNNIVRTFQHSYFNKNRSKMNHHLMSATIQPSIYKVLGAVYYTIDNLNFSDLVLIKFIELSSFADVFQQNASTSVDTVLTLVTKWIKEIVESKRGVASLRLAHCYEAMCLFILITSQLNDNSFVDGEKHHTLLGNLKKLIGDFAYENDKKVKWVGGSLKEIDHCSEWNERQTTRKYMFVYPRKCQSAVTPLMCIRNRFDRKAEKNQHDNAINPHFQPKCLETPQIVHCKIVHIFTDTRKEMRGIVHLIKSDILLPFKLMEGDLFDLIKRNLKPQLNDDCTALVSFWAYGIDATFVQKCTVAIDNNDFAMRAAVEQDDLYLPATLQRNSFNFGYVHNFEQLHSRDCKIKLFAKNEFPTDSAYNFSSVLQSLFKGVIIGNSTDTIYKKVRNFDKDNKLTLVSVPISKLGNKIYLNNNKYPVSVVWFAKSCVSTKIESSTWQLDNLEPEVNISKLFISDLNNTPGSSVRLVFCLQNRTLMAVREGLIVIRSGTSDNLRSGDGGNCDVGVIVFPASALDFQATISHVNQIHSSVINLLLQIKGGCFDESSLAAVTDVKSPKSSNNKNNSDNNSLGTAKEVSILTKSTWGGVKQTAINESSTVDSLPVAEKLTVDSATKVNSKSKKFKKGSKIDGLFK